MKVVIRIALLLAITIGVSFAVQAQETEGCYVCRHFTDEDGYSFQYCGYPDNNSWGYQSCGIGSGRMFNYCRNWGFSCYYFDVN